MTRLPHHLDEAASATDDAGLDLTTLHGRARRRRRRRQGRIAVAAAVFVAGGIVAIGVAGAWSTPEESVTAAEGDGTEGVVDTSVPEPVEEPVTETPSIPEPTEETPPSPSEPVTPTSEPVAPSTGSVTPSTTSPGPRTLELRGTYEGEERYVVGTPACPDITHTLDMSLTMEDGSPWVGREDYCGAYSGLQWNGVGTFRLTAPDGSALAGAFTSTAPMGTSGQPYSLEVREGSGTYAGATGSCDVSIVVTPVGFGRQTQAGSIACTLSVP